MNEYENSENIMAEVSTPREETDSIDSTPAESIASKQGFTGNQAASSVMEETAEKENTSSEPEAYRKEVPDPGIALIKEELEKIRRNFETKLMYDQYKDSLLDKLHGELQEYKSDLLAKIICPILMDIIGVCDQLGKEITYFKGQSPTESEKVIKSLENLLVYLQEILYRQSTEPYSAEVGSIFVPGRQKAIRTLPTEDEMKNKTVAECLVPGYEFRGKQIRPEWVNVFLYKQPESGKSGQ